MTGMDSLLVDRAPSVEVLQKAINITSMYGRRSAAPRPLSEATLIFDTDDEDDNDDDEEEEQISPTSLEYDSHSSLSSQDELTTPPDTAGLGGFTFHFDSKPVTGPIGPHLFRAYSTDGSHEILELSPVPVAKTETRRVSTLPAAVAQLDETQVRDWSPSQVADWMAEAGFEASVVEKFLIHDIYGSVLLDLQFEDLKEIDIESFGKRRKVMTSIQHLRNSSIPSDLHLNPAPSPERPHRLVVRAPHADEARFVAPQNIKPRRARRAYDDIITPAESVSIVAIEQVLPEPHICPKGEQCPKWQKQQRKIQKLTNDFVNEVEKPDNKSVIAPSTIGPSIAGSSDVFGPSSLPITAERLNNVQPRDPQESVRQFLDFQSTQKTKGLSPPSAPSALFAAKSSNLRQELPRLTIPSMVQSNDSPDRTPISALRNPTQAQSELKAALRSDPFHYGGVASPVDVYRVQTPMSATDIPITAIPIDPCQRNVSQSVPPEMRFGTAPTVAAELIQRSSSTRPARRRQPSFIPAITPVVESPPVVTNEVDLANHAGWMRKRMPARMLRHEWQDQYFSLNGSRLDMFKNERESSVLDTINVDAYEVHAYTTASGSKLKSAFSKAASATSKEPSFAFTLIAEDQKERRMFEKSRNHHFAVASGKDRVEWMRKLMLAKAMKKNNTTAI